MEQLTNCISCQSTQFLSIQKTEAMMHPSKKIFNFDQCQNCELVFLNPRVPEKDLGQYYTDYYLPYRGDQAWGKYEKFVASSQKNIDKKRVATVKKYVDNISKSTVLDVGCGKPTFLKMLFDQYKCRAIGTDFSNFGWKNSMAKYQNLELLEGDIHELANLPKADVITMWHYLEHDYNPSKTLQKLLSISKSTTRLIVEVPNFNSSSQKKYGKHWAGFHTPRHTALYTPHTMTQLMQRNGWKVETAFSYGSLDPYILDWMSRKEAENLDWSKSMESEFVKFVIGMVGYFPKSIFQKKKSLGFMTVIALPN
ncbi:MAG: class I SAM-dependent methyltransferase [Saprospiraceae bacterium]